MPAAAAAGPAGPEPATPSNPQSATLATSASATVSYSLRGALVRGPMQPTTKGVPRVAHVRQWLKQFARQQQGRGVEVDTIELWQQQQQKLVSQRLQLAGQEAEEAEAEAALDGEHPAHGH